MGQIKYGFGWKIYIYYLTAKGNKVLSNVFPHWSKAQEQVQKILGGELDSFRKNLKNINTNLI